LADDDESRIRALIESWARAVHEGDIDGVLADHADDIVMFDVPPPNDGVRGIDAYRETWPPFFRWQEQGASFEIVCLSAPQAKMSPLPTRCCAAALERSSGRTPRTVYASRSA
jgi:ketosteroid isomerase-like protein